MRCGEEKKKVCVEDDGNESQSRVPTMRAKYSLGIIRTY